MALVRLENFSLSLNGKILFRDVNLSIQSGDKIGLIGDNGAGKTSLLKSIAKALEEHDGQVAHARGLQCEYIEQGFPEGWRELSAQQVLQRHLHDPAGDQWKIEYVLELCGVPPASRSIPCHQLSGGWKKIVMFAKAILLEPDLLLLDEPTNHLDQAHIAGIIRLLGQSHSIPAFVVVSHNRDFLDAVTQKTLIVHDRQVSGFDFSFTRARQLFLAQQQAAANARLDIMDEIQRLKKSARLQRQIGVDHYSDKALQKAKKIEKKIQVIESSVPEKNITRKAEIALKVSDAKARKILHVEGLKLYAGEARLLFSIDTLVINRGDRLVISGANGCGKSTLLNAIVQGSDPSIRINPSVRFAVIDQELSFLPADSEVLEYVATQHALDRQQAINLLAGIGFSYTESQRRIGQLSYGERARLALLTLRLINPNFLILDEPTNHLDITSQELLESEIRRLNPAALIVSHDSRFIENVGTRFFEVKGNVLGERL